MDYCHNDSVIDYYLTERNDTLIIGRLLRCDTEADSYYSVAFTTVSRPGMICELYAFDIGRSLRAAQAVFSKLKRGRVGAVGAGEVLDQLLSG